jgi:hypothetical protein
VVPRLSGVVEDTHFAGVSVHRLDDVLERLAREVGGLDQLVEVVDIGL